MTRFSGREISLLVEQRWLALNQLLEIASRQLDAIHGCRMSELMSLLSDKQVPLTRLLEISEQLRRAADEPTSLRHWDSQSQREDCRRRQEECQQLHLDLLAIEAECESALQQSRVSLQQRIERIDSAKSAATEYGRQQQVATSGARLDLFSA